MSKRITVSLEEEDVDVVESVLLEDDVESQAEAVRRCIRRARDLEDQVETLREEKADLEAEVERQENARLKLIEQREENDELVRYVDDELSRRERRRRAPAWKRAKWWLLGEGKD